jgi:WD40 repeat protein
VLAAAVVAVVTLIAVAVALPFLLHGGSVASVREDTTERDDSRSFAQTQMTNAEPAPRVTVHEGPKEDTGKKETPAATQRENPDTGRGVGKPKVTPLAEGVLCRLAPQNRIDQVAFARDGSRAAGSSQHNSLFLCSLAGPPQDKEPAPLRQLDWIGEDGPRGQYPAVTGLAITHDGQGVYYGMRARKASEPNPRSALRLWDTRSSDDPGFWPELPIKDITRIALSETGGIAVAGTANLAGEKTVAEPATVLVWHLQGQKPNVIQVFKGDMGTSALAVAVSSNGTRAAWCVSSDLEELLVLWDVTKNGEKRRIPGRVQCIAFSPDGDQLAYADGGSLHLIGFEDGREAGPFLPPEGVSSGATFCSVAFSADGKWIIAGDNDGGVHLWDVATRKELPRWPKKHEKRGKVIAVGLHPKGEYAYSAASGGDNAIRRWWTPKTPKP